MMAESIKKEEEKTISIKFKDMILVEDVSPDISIFLCGLKSREVTIKQLYQNSEGILELYNILKKPPSLIVLRSHPSSNVRYITILQAQRWVANSISKFNYRILWESEGHRLKRVLHEILGEKR
mgnify:CR=1 FL=1